MFCDLHAHSTASDGVDLPERLPLLAQQAGLRAIALTDHDTTDGLPAAAATAAEIGIDFVPGIEISADPGPRPGEPEDAPRRGTLHILGLFVRHDDPLLAQVSARMRAARDSRNPAIVDKLRALGVQITAAEVTQLAAEQGTQSIGRPHVAQVLMAKGYVKSVQDAFNRYLGQGKPAYVRRDRMSAGDAIAAIHHAGGVAIMAHPIQLVRANPDELEDFLIRLQRVGLDGVETRHSDHSPALVKQYEALAKRLGLLTSGGSDYHGSRKPVALGSQQVPLSVYQTLRDRAAGR